MKLASVRSSDFYIRSALSISFEKGCLALMASIFSSSAPAANGSQAAIDTSKIWTTLLTNRGYLAGLLVLDHTIKKHGSKYQLVVMLSGDAANDPEMHATLQAAGVPFRLVDKIEPAPQNGKINRGTWEKLAPWSFTEYEVSYPARSIGSFIWLHANALSDRKSKSLVNRD